MYGVTRTTTGIRIACGIGTLLLSILSTARSGAESDAELPRQSASGCRSSEQDLCAQLLAQPPGPAR